MQVYHLGDIEPFLPLSFSPNGFMKATFTHIQSVLKLSHCQELKIGHQEGRKGLNDFGGQDHLFAIQIMLCR